MNCRPPALTARPTKSYEQPTLRILGEGNLHDFEIRHKHLDGRSLEHIGRGSSDATDAEVQQATNDAGSAETAIEMATIKGARAIRMERPEWYSLYSEVQNLVYSASGDSVETVFIDGKIIMEDRQVKTVDEEEILERCQECAVGILERSGVKVPGKWPIL